MIFVFFWIFFIVALVFIVSGFLGAPFVPSQNRQLLDMLDIADIHPADLAADLGSGDGRVVIAFARAGIEAHGYEINPFLVLWSLARIYRAGVWGRGHIHWKSYWRADLSSYNLITIYGAKPIMSRLKNKLCRELPGDACVICNTFPLPGMRHLRHKNDIYLYIPQFSEEPS